MGTPSSSALSPKGRSSSEQADLFYEPLLSTYLDGLGTIPRDWLQDEIQERISRPGCRFALLIGEPGAGKTGFMAALARSNPGWLRYFVRLDSTTPLSGGDAVSMMMRIGHQLAHVRPEIFDPALLQIEITQRVEHAGASASVVGVKIDDLQVSPFYHTAIRVRQSVASLAGSLIGLEISRATLEPRLLELGALSHLALLDPASVLARKLPDEKIVVLIDALDEVMTMLGTMTVLDWLETVEELPPNIRFVLSSRPHPRLATLGGIRGSSLEIVHIDADSDRVAKDVRLFATTLFDNTKALARAPSVGREAAVSSLARAAQGNFAYLTAYARSLQTALAAGSDKQLQELLEFEALPAGLPQLYAAFVRRMRRQIEALGHLEIASPHGPDDDFVPAWGGVGQRLLGVLSVAFAPLSLKQLLALGGVRVWESAARNVLQTLVPFLDESEFGWKLFHPSIAEFLKSADRNGAADLAIDAHEWHTRIVRYFRGSGQWADVDWRAVDSYGLRHVAAHLAATGANPAAISELVTSRLRVASRERFLSDLPFRRLLETAHSSVKGVKGVASVLSDGLFFQLVRLGISAVAEQLHPAVYGLMARLGRVEEALARAQVLEPSLRKYRTLDAIWQSTPAGLRAALGPLDGVELLIDAALEIPPTAGRVVGWPGFDRGNCLRDAAVALVPYSLQRALSLAELADEYDPVPRGSDAVREAAAALAAPEKALELLADMNALRPGAAMKAAEKAPVGAVREDLIAFAIAHLDDEDTSRRMPLVARLIVLLNTQHSDRAREMAASLRTILERWLADGLSSDERRDAVRAAEILHDTNSELAVWLLQSCDCPEMDSVLANTVTESAQVWASWGRLEDARLRLNRALDAFGGRNAYESASGIAKAAGVAATIDPKWGKKLAEEAIALIESAVKQADSYEGRLAVGVLDVRHEFEAKPFDAILADMVAEFRHRNRETALRLARWISSSGGWIPGLEWNSTYGRNGALASLGFDAAQEDPALAAQLLSECLANGEGEVRLGRSDPRLAESILFSSKDASSGRVPRQMRAELALVHTNNAVNYWIGGRKSRCLWRPADVVRSIEAFAPDTASWARAVADAVQSVAAVDLDRAVALAYWPADPGERLIGLAALGGVLDERDARLQTTLAAIAATVDQLPRYQAEIDLKSIPQGPILLYLDPTIRARFEAALLMAARSSPYRLLPEDDEELWYLRAAREAEEIFRGLLAGEFSGIAPEDLEQQMDALSADYSGFDDILRDLLEVAASYELASKDIARSDARIERIAQPYLKAAAKLFRLDFGVQGDPPFAVKAVQILGAVNEEASPLHRAELAATTARKLEPSGQEANMIFDWGLRQIEDSDPLTATRGLVALSVVAPTERRTQLLSRALRSSDEVANHYLRGDAVADLLGPAVATGDSALVASILDRLLAAGWNRFMEGLRRAMPNIVAAAGAGIVENIDTSMRRAQVVLCTHTPSRQALEHLDGVLAPTQREQALRAASDELLGAYLSTYLDQADVGPLFRWVQDSRVRRPDPDDDVFARLRGRRTGLSAWMASYDQPLWHIMDIRFLFDSETDARAYHLERLQANSEGKAPVAQARAVGEECHVFGAKDSLRNLTAFYYLFCVGQVAVKLFVAQGAESSEPLTPNHLVPLGERIVEKIQIAGLGRS
jgi:hypothetical protein